MPKPDPNQAQQDLIKEALLMAVPNGVLYKNLILALMALLKTMIEQALSDEIFLKRR